MAAMSGGKACGQASVMLHWDDDSPLRKALTGYVQGRRVRTAQDEAPAATCPQSASVYSDFMGIFGFYGDVYGILLVFGGNLIVFYVFFRTFWDFLCQLAWNHWDFMGIHGV